MLIYRQGKSQHYVCLKLIYVAQNVILLMLSKRFSFMTFDLEVLLWG